MIKKLQRVSFLSFFLFLSALFSLVIAATVGIYELPDGYFYVVLGQYLLTGFLLPVYPFNAVKPATLFGPLYGLLTAPIVVLPPPWGMTILAFLQVFGICVSGILLFYTAKMIFKGKNAFLTVGIFFLLPFVWLYATSLMTEAITTFFISVYIYFAVYFITKKTKLPPSILVFLSVVLMLTKNVFLFLIPISFVVWFLIRRNEKRNDSIEQSIGRSIPAYLGIAGLLWWMMFNYMHHGVFTTTINTGRHLYNNVVHQAHLLPPENSKIYQIFIDRAGSVNAFWLPEWEAQKFFITDFQLGSITEVQMDNLFKEFSLAAIKAQPGEWVLNAVGVFFADLMTPPYHKTVFTMMGLTDAQCPECVQRTCRIVWNKNLCLPMNPNDTIIHAWGNWAIFERSFLYPYGMAILSIFSFIGVVAAAVKRNIPLLFVAFLFFFFLVLQAAVQEVEGRYLLPLYPLYALLIAEGIRYTIELFMNYQHSLQNTDEWKMS